MKKQIKTKGISLIVLVITIIVMIILAGAIIISLTNGNVITKSKEARNKINMSSYKDKWNVAYSSVLSDNVGIAPTDAQVLTAFGEVPTDYLVNSSAIIYTGLDNLILQHAYDIGLDTRIPKGFYYVGGTIATGIVISDDSADSNKGDTSTTLVGNQFVWIPVNNMSEFYRVSDFNTFSAIATGTSYNGSSEQLEYNKMLESVKKYNGFYIARYEAGKNVSTAPLVDGSVKPLSIQGKYAWNNIKFDDAYVSGYGDSTHNGIVKVSRSMYPDTNNYLTYGYSSLPSNTTNAISTLMYGEQWDATMRYIQNITNANASGAKFILNSTLMGNYTQTIANTGSSSSYKVNNIYDLAGNIMEYTMETYSGGMPGDDCRAARGGGYTSDGVNIPARYRTGFPPNPNPVGYTGFRVALYIK